MYLLKKTKFMKYLAGGLALTLCLVLAKNSYDYLKKEYDCKAAAQALYNRCDMVSQFPAFCGTAASNLYYECGGKK